MALEKFCFCSKLRNGAFIWGVLSTIINAIVLTAFISMDGITQEIPSYRGYEPHTLYRVILISLFINLKSSVFLVIGAVKRNHLLMLPWIILNGIALIPFVLAAVLLLFVVAPIYGPIYIWWSICSAYQKVQQESENNFLLLLPIDSDLKPLDEATN